MRVARPRNGADPNDPGFQVRDIRPAPGVDAERLKLPQGVRVQMRGEVSSMRQSFAQMGFSLVLAVLLVYLVMAAQFSSWLDPLVMIVAAAAEWFLGLDTEQKALEEVATPLTAEHPEAVRVVAAA